MKIKLLLSIVWTICCPLVQASMAYDTMLVLSTYFWSEPDNVVRTMGAVASAGNVANTYLDMIGENAMHYLGTPFSIFMSSKTPLMIKKIAIDGLVTITQCFYEEETTTMGDLQKQLGTKDEYVFFYYKKPASNELLVDEYIERQLYGGMCEAYHTIAMHCTQVDMVMRYEAIANSYRALPTLQYYTYASDLHTALKVTGYIRREVQHIAKIFPRELGRLIKSFVFSDNIRCIVPNSICMETPTQKKLLLTSAYIDNRGNLIFDLLSSFLIKNKPCKILNHLPKELIFFIYMYKDHFLYVKLLRWLTYTNKLPCHNIYKNHKKFPFCKLKKSCIDHLIATGTIPKAVLKHIVREAWATEAWEVLLSLAYHGFLTCDCFSDPIPYDTLLYPMGGKKWVGEYRAFISYYYTHLANNKLFGAMIAELITLSPERQYYCYDNCNIALKKRIFAYLGLTKSITLGLCPASLATRQAQLSLLLPVITVMQEAVKEGNFIYACELLKRKFVLPNIVAVDPKQIIAQCETASSFPPYMDTFLQKVLAAQPTYVAQLWTLLKAIPAQSSTLAYLKSFLKENFTS